MISAKSFARLCLQLGLGIDTMIGLGTYVVLSFIFQEPFNPWFLSFAEFCAYLPDVDFAWFLLQSQEKRKWGHWRLGLHHPLLITLPIVGIATWVLSSKLLPLHATFLTLLAVLCVTEHFIHDSTKMGLHWLSPLTRDGRISFRDATQWTHFIIRSGGVRIVPEEELQAVYKKIAHDSHAGSRSDELANRIEPVTCPQIAALAICIAGLIVLILLV